MPLRSRDIVAAVDIGTSQIRAALAREAGAEGMADILSFADRDCDGAVVKGEITDAGKVHALLRDAIREVERAASTEINPDNLYVGIAGGHIRSRTSGAAVHVDSEDRRVEPRHLEEALETAYKSATPHGFVRLCSVDGAYTLDDTRHVADPVGQAATKLEARPHVILGDANRVESFLAPFRDIGFDHPKPVFTGLATAYAVLTSDDLQHGTLVIDMGAGCMEYLLFHNYLLMDSGVLTVGLDHAANDISLALDIPFPVARRILGENAARRRRMDGHLDIELPEAFGNRRLPIDSVDRVVELRLSETFDIVKQRLDEKGFDGLIGNGVLCCGGLARVPCAVDLLRKCFNTPAAPGRSHGAIGPDPVVKCPRHHGVVGLLKYGLEARRVRRKGAGLIRNFSDGLWGLSRNMWRSLFDALNL